MIIADDFRLDFDVLIKALTGEHAAPAGAAAGGGGAPAPGQSAPRSGHKYVRRWWDGGQWQYEYPGEGGSGGHRGQMHYGDHEKREHQLELPEGHQFGPGQEKEAYQSAWAEALKPGAVHQAQDPTGNGQAMTVKVRSGGAGRPPIVEVYDSTGNKSQKFESPAAYEKWFRTLAMGPVKFTSGGKVIAKIIPNLGKADEEGHLTPSNDRRLWVADIGDDVDPEVAALLKQGEKRAGKNIGRFSTKEAAQQILAQRLAYVAQQKGIQFDGDTAGAPAASQPLAQAPAEQPMVARTAAVDAPTPTPSPAAGGGGAQPGPAAQPSSDINLDAAQREQWQNYLSQTQDPKKFDALLQQVGWRDEPDPESRKMVRRLAATPEDKQKLVDQLAIQYTPIVRKIANEMAPTSEAGRVTSTGVSEGDRTGPLQSRRDQFLEQVFGDVPPDNNTPFLPAEGSWLRGRLEAILDNYDPAKTNGGIAAYASRSLRGDLKNYAGQMHQQNANRVSQTATDDTGRSTDLADQGLTSEGGERETTDLEQQAVNWEDWQKKQTSRIYQLARDKQIPKDVLNYLLNVVPKIRNDDMADKFGQGMNKYGWGDYIWGKAMQLASQVLADELRKATAKTSSPFLTRDKNVDPSHQYAHMEGDEDHPRYFFRDALGNLIRYTNAPTGHSDASKRMGEAKIHPAEPSMDNAPQFFDPTGRKLSRAPYPGAQVEWNPSYHPHDPQNMWAGRWVNPITGEHEHTYVDADMRMIPKMYLHQTIALVDVRLPVLRKYYSTLSTSPMLKDKIVAAALALIDQGRFRAEELTVLTPADVVDRGAIFKIGNRFIYADQKLRSILQMMTRGRSGAEPLFAVPFVKKDGEVDPMLLRRVGPHFLQCTFDQVGITLSGLHVYHASQLFSREVQRLLLENQVSWETALEYATVAVAQEMGHDLSREPDIAQALPLVRELLIDPIVIEVLQRNAARAGLVGEATTMLPLPPPAVCYVSLDLKTRTADEDEFSKWLHGYPAHLHAEEENFVAPRRPAQVVPNKANTDDAQPPQPEADPSTSNNQSRFMTANEVRAIGRSSRIQL